MSTRRPPAPKRAGAPKPSSAPAAASVAPTRANTVAIQTTAAQQTSTPKAASPAKTVNRKSVLAKPAAKRPTSGPTPRIPNRISIYDAARPQNVRQRLDNLEAAAQSSAAPETLTARTLIGAVIVLLVAALLVPTLRGALEQSQHISALQSQLEAGKSKSEELDHELARWEDPAFIEAEARSRLGYVRPGDQVWRTVGGEILTENIDPITGLQADAGVVGSTAGQPWYEALLESFLIANGPVEQTDDLNEILSRTQSVTD